MGTTGRPLRAAGRADRLLERFSRVTSGGALIPEIDGLRFIAILAVVLFHLHQYLKKRGPVVFDALRDDGPLVLASRHGYLGVQLFFVISGFILALPFARQYLEGRPRPALGAYYRRRLTRLEPPYVINLLVVFLLLVISKPERAASLWPNLLASLVYVHNLVFGTGSAVNYVAWSLEVEVQFYVLAPLLTTIFLVRRPGVRRTVLLSGMFAAPLFFPGKPFQLLLVGQIHYFLTGLLLADIFLTDWHSAPERGLRWDLLATAALLAVPLWGRQGNRKELALPLLFLAICCGAFRGRAWGLLLRNRWVTTVGGMCYTIYLYHFFAISAVARHTVSLSAGHGYGVALIQQIVLVVPIVIVLGAILFVVFERPFMFKEWPERFLGWVRSGADRRVPPGRT